MRPVRQVRQSFWETSTMTADELQQLRDVLAIRRAALIDRMATDATDATGTLEAAFVSLLADTHTAIAAVDAALAESTITGDAP
jgi:hypothetical protein